MSSKADRSEKRFTKAEKSWIMYDWANSIYATNIMAAIFPIYFAMQADETGNKLYGFAVSAAALVVAVLAPILGAIGDFSGMKKKLFAGFLVLGLVVMAAFEDWRLMLVGFILSRIGFSGSCLFYDSFLTDVTTPERMDRVSSWGYAMGYIGGSTIPFIISIAIMLLMNQSVLSYKIAIMIVVVWWAVFSIPFLKNVKQQYSVEDAPQALAKEAFRNAWKTFKDILKDKKILFFIIAYFFYIDGVDTIISMATNYGETLGLGAIGMILALLVTQIVAVPFSILFGNLAKKVGAMRMIAIAVCVYFVITILGFFMGFNIEQAELSGGETQRLMLARALYKDGPIIALDEPTAALDPIAENDIYQKYSSMTQGRTSLFISHRLASTRFCDRIIMLKDGCISEEGTHDELMRRGGEYAKLFAVQSKYYREGGREYENENRE